jgi:hypothetical protein
MDDETIERRWCVIRHALEAAQQHTGDETKDKQDQIVHLFVIPVKTGIQ